MPRQARTAGEYLHIIVRGIGKQILFEDSADREKYLLLLKRYSAGSEITILAYCLMENHVHLLVRDTSAAISVFMKKMGVSYAQYYNRKYDRLGHLFQDRYKSENISGDQNLLSAFRYILNNPREAGLCRVEDYPWSNYHEYGKEGGLTDTRMLYAMIGNEAELQSFLQREDDATHLDADTHKKDDAWALAMIQKELHIKSGTQLQQMERLQRDEALAFLKSKGISIRQLERLTGINRGVIQKA